jgi:hypothetical protein
LKNKQRSSNGEKLTEQIVCQHHGVTSCQNAIKCIDDCQIIIRGNSILKLWFIRKKVEMLIRLMDSRLRSAGMTALKRTFCDVVNLDMRIIQGTAYFICWEFGMVSPEFQNRQDSDSID